MKKDKEFIWGCLWLVLIMALVHIIVDELYKLNTKANIEIDNNPLQV